MNRSANLHGFMFFLLMSFSSLSLSAELSGVSVEDQITAANGDTLILNGIGLREKLWIDVYVGSLYLGQKASSLEEVLAQNSALRIQLNVVYKEFASKKLLKAFRDGFEKNQDADTLSALQDRIDLMYSFFGESAKKGDVYIFECLPQKGCNMFKNDTLLGTIAGDDFKKALVEIWLGQYPADKGLKKGLLGAQ